MPITGCHFTIKLRVSTVMTTNAFFCYLLPSKKVVQNMNCHIAPLVGLKSGLVDLELELEVCDHTVQVARQVAYQLKTSSTSAPRLSA